MKAFTGILHWVLYFINSKTSFIVRCTITLGTKTEKNMLLTKPDTMCSYSEFLFNSCWKNSLEFFRYRCVNHTYSYTFIRRKIEVTYWLRYSQNSFKFRFWLFWIIFSLGVIYIYVFPQNVLLCTSRRLVATKVARILSLMALKYSLDYKLRSCSSPDKPPGKKSTLHTNRQRQLTQQSTLVDSDFKVLLTLRWTSISKTLKMKKSAYLYWWNIVWS